MEVIEIDVVELAARRTQGVWVVDVRNPSEYVEARVPDAKLVPLPDLPDLLHEVPRDATVYVICRSGARSRTACEFLIREGFDAVNVAGGMLAWVEAGYEFDTGP